MLAPPKPPDEIERLASLYALNLLDTPHEERFDRISRLAQALFDVPITYISLMDANRQWFKSCVGADITEADPDVSFCGYTILDTKPLIVPDTLEDARFADSPHVTGEVSLRFYAGFPLRSPSGHNVGTLCLMDFVPRAFSEDDHARFAELAALAEREIATGEIAELHQSLSVFHERERTFVDGVVEMLALGRRIQEDFLPADLPTLDGWSMHAHLIPAMEVSGDFYDAYTLPDGRLMFAVGDVSGKGVGAALFMALVRTLLRVFAERDGGQSSARCLTRDVNTYLAQHHTYRSSMFATLFVGLLDPRTGHCLYVNAGHCAPLVLRADGTRTTLAANSPAVGITASPTFSQASYRLAPGDALCIYTDGLSEARRADGVLLEDHGLDTMLTDFCATSRCMDDLEHALDTAGDVHDDVTLFILERTLQPTAVS